MRVSDKVGAYVDVGDALAQSFSTFTTARHVV